MTPPLDVMPLTVKVALLEMPTDDNTPVATIFDKLICPVLILPEDRRFVIAAEPPISAPPDCTLPVNKVKMVAPVVVNAVVLIEGDDTSDENVPVPAAIVDPVTVPALLMVPVEVMPTAVSKFVVMLSEADTFEAIMSVTVIVALLEMPTDVTTPVENKLVACISPVLMLPDVIKFVTSTSDAATLPEVWNPAAVTVPAV